MENVLFEMTRVLLEKDGNSSTLFTIRDALKDVLTYTVTKSTFAPGESSMRTDKPNKAKALQPTASGSTRKHYFKQFNYDRFTAELDKQVNDSELALSIRIALEAALESDPRYNQTPWFELTDGERISLVDNLDVVTEVLRAISRASVDPGEANSYLLLQ
jgi:hypothetical protein